MNEWAVVPALPWLLAVGWQDARKGVVSNWLTIPPLCLSTWLWLARGEWSVGLLLALLLAVGEASERLHLTATLGIGPVVVAAGWLAGHSSCDARLIVTVWTCAWIAWTLHLAGGADAKVLMALVALFPDPALVVILIGAQVAWSIYHLVRRYRGRALQVALTGTLAHPTAEDLAAHGLPLLPVYAAAGGAFLAARMLAEHLTTL